MGVGAEVAASHVQLPAGSASDAARVPPQQLSPCLTNQKQRSQRSCGGPTPGSPFHFTAEAPERRYKEASTPIPIHFRPCASTSSGCPVEQRTQSSPQPGAAWSVLEQPHSAPGLAFLLLSLSSRAPSAPQCLSGRSLGTGSQLSNKSHQIPDRFHLPRPSNCKKPVPYFAQIQKSWPSTGAPAPMASSLPPPPSCKPRTMGASMEVPRAPQLRAWQPDAALPWPLARLACGAPGPRATSALQ